MVHAVAALNRIDMRALRSKGKRLPSLYKAGVRYREEPWPRERWLTAAQVLKQGHGDCEDLVAWRVAELLESGVEARPAVIRTSRNVWHVILERGTGEREDPSRRLGMKGPG